MRPLVFVAALKPYVFSMWPSPGRPRERQERQEGPQTQLLRCHGCSQPGSFQLVLMHVFFFFFLTPPNSLEVALRRTE